jgi:metal-responsive CopG/Arc/MetJ family transcriptional regulator
MNADAFKNVTVQFTPDLLAQVDERAKQLDLNRSQYLRRLARKDCEKDSQPKTQSTQPLEQAA